MAYNCEVCECSFSCNSKLQRHKNSKSHSVFLESLSLQKEAVIIMSADTSPEVNHDATVTTQSNEDSYSYEVVNKDKVLLIIRYNTDVQNSSSDDMLDAHGDLFTLPQDISDELGESMGMSIKLVTVAFTVFHYYCTFTECDAIMRELMIHEGRTSGNYYPFPSKVFALLYLLVHSPRRIVSMAWVVE